MRQKRIGTRERKLRKRIEALNEAGVIAWSGQRLRQAKPAGKVSGNKTVAEFVIENRE